MVEENSKKQAHKKVKTTKRNRLERISRRGQTFSKPIYIIFAPLLLSHGVFDGGGGVFRRKAQIERKLGGASVGGVGGR